MDIDVLLWFQEHRCGFLDAVMNACSTLGGDVIALAFVCLVFWCMNRREGNRMVLNMFSGLVLNQLIKIAVAARRPWVRDSRIRPYGSTLNEQGVPVGGAIVDATAYSFPSGHTANAVSVFGGYTYKRQWWLNVIVWIFVALIAVSRMYLGVHTPQDVAFSIVFGIILVILMDKLADALEKKPSLDIVIVGVFLLLGVATVIITLIRMNGAPVDDNTRDAFKTTGANAGVMLGWLLERRTVRFERPKTVFKGIIRFAVGVAVTVAFLELPKTLLNNMLGEICGNLLRYFLTCFVAIYLYPMAFKKLNF